MQAVKTQIIMPYQAADTMWQVPCCWTRRVSWPRCLSRVSGGCVTWRHSSYLVTGVWTRGWRPLMCGASRWSAPGQCGACGPWVLRGREQSRHHLRESSEWPGPRGLGTCAETGGWSAHVPRVTLSWQGGSCEHHDYNWSAVTRRVRYILDEFSNLWL